MPPSRGEGEHHTTAAEAAENQPIPPNHRASSANDPVTGDTPAGDPLHVIQSRRFHRREVLRGIAATVASVAAGGSAFSCAGHAMPQGKGAGTPSRIPGPDATLDFKGLPAALSKDHAVAEGYRADVVIRWGDKVLPGAPRFRPGAVDPTGQTLQFGYNNDFLAFQPLPKGSGSSDHGLLCVNHEYTDRELMWPGVRRKEDLNEEHVRHEMAAHGHSVIEVKRNPSGAWETVPDGRWNRRITANTPMRLAGPAAGSPRLRTSADPSGTRVLGTINNCAGGSTPWGTVLMAEENFNGNFNGDPRVASDGDPLELERMLRLGLGRPWYSWGDFEPRFHLEREPNEPNRFGWIVEYDPYDPEHTPIKRTALGRCKHEGATVCLAPDGRAVVYTGDDQQNEYLYRFVSAGTWDPEDPRSGRDLLNEGTLSVARFHEDGSMEWLPLIHGQSGLEASRGFGSQGDVLIDTRRAADVLGATPMDRPEDVEVSPTTGKVYVMLTKNTGRGEDAVDAANPRGPNPHGHIVELTPPVSGGEADHSAARFGWEILLRGGDPTNATHGASYHPDTERDGAVLNCDNGAFDPAGRLWIATDQGRGQVASGFPDGLRACPVEGDERALTRLFYRTPLGAELCGPCFTPDGTTLFVSVQHPGEGKHMDGSTESTFDNPATRWPDFDRNTPPRPSVVAITRNEGGPIGG